MSTDLASTVTISFKDLALSKSDHRLVDAFGPGSLGILIVTGLPEKYKELRRRVLQNATKLANLPLEQLNKLELPESYWLVGWSCGKERLASGLPDNFKGSFYVNCDFYSDYNNDNTTKKFSRQDIVNFKEYTTENVWPEKHEIPRFEEDLKELLKLMIDVAVTVAKACDRYIANNKQKNGSNDIQQVERGYLEQIVKTSNSTKARLLHYFASIEAEKTIASNKVISNSSGENTTYQDDDWCGEHVDHSCLTALTSEYLIENEVLHSEFIPNNQYSDNAGLFIRDRNGKPVKVNIPKDAMAFQAGSSLEVISKGLFRAIPHYVKSPSSSHISRNTLAVFCQPSLHDKVGDKDFVTYAHEILANNH